MSYLKNLKNQGYQAQIGGIVGGHTLSTLIRNTYYFAMHVSIWKSQIIDKVGL